MTEYLFVQDNEIHMLGYMNEISYILLYNLFEIAIRSDKPTIDIHISSQGGFISELDKVIMLIQSCEKPIHAYIHNTKYYDIYSGVASAASVLVSFCRQVFIDEDATFMIHHSRRNILGITKIIENEEDIIYWMERTNQPYDIINYLVKNEVTFDAITAKNLGFVHKINGKNDPKYFIPIGCQINKNKFTNIEYNQ
jgi:ATP-dependent protease ClpP protease subunit